MLAVWSFCVVFCVWLTFVSAKCSFKKVHVLWMVDGCHLRVTMWPGTALNLNPIFIGEWLQCRTTRHRNKLFIWYIYYLHHYIIYIHNIKTFSLHVSHFWIWYSYQQCMCRSNWNFWHISNVLWWQSRHLLWEKSALVCCSRLWLTSGGTGVPTGALPPSFRAGCPKRPTYIWTTGLETDSRWNPY